MKLFPALRERFGGRTMVIVLDNASTHCDPVVAELIEAEGHVVQYLPPYSPDYNPIELTFSVLKAWMKRNYVYHRHQIERFGDFLEEVVRASRCDQYARKHFKHAAGGLYIEREELAGAQDRIRAYERGQAGLAE